MMADDINEPYMLYDTKERAFVSFKEYASRKSANRVADQKNQEYGAHRYQPEKYSDIIGRSMKGIDEEPSAGSMRRPMGGGRGEGPSKGNLLHEMNPQKLYKKGGKVSASSRADGIAQRGKTKGRVV
jgi:hypothetical protein